MAIITLPSFEIRCFVCDRKMAPNRKYLDFCTVKCQRKGATRLNELMDKAFEGPITNANIKV